MLLRKGVEDMICMECCILNKRKSLLVLVVLSLLVAGADGALLNQSQRFEFLITQEISLQAVSWKAFDFDCVVDDVLSGSFEITVDGDLFPGDQTKYDNWLLGGITFLILDEENFDLWSQGNSVVAHYERENIIELSWSFNVPSNGKWYVVYINNSVYIKRIELNINHTRVFEYNLVVIILVTAAISAALGLYVIKRKK
jgi:hypothetical protein